MVSKSKAAGLDGELFTDLIQGTEGLLQLLIDDGAAIRIGDRVVLVELLNTLKRDIKGYFSKNARLTPSDFKSLTQLSRRTAIPLLEWLDREGVTRRDGDARVAG